MSLGSGECVGVYYSIFKRNWHRQLDVKWDLVACLETWVQLVQSAPWHQNEVEFDAELSCLQMPLECQAKIGLYWVENGFGRLVRVIKTASSRTYSCSHTLPAYDANGASDRDEMRCLRYDENVCQRSRAHSVNNRE